MQQNILLGVTCYYMLYGTKCYLILHVTWYYRLHGTTSYMVLYLVGTTCYMVPWYKIETLRPCSYIRNFYSKDVHCYHFYGIDGRMFIFSIFTSTMKKCSSLTFLQQQCKNVHLYHYICNFQQHKF